MSLLWIKITMDPHLVRIHGMRKALDLQLGHYLDRLPPEVDLAKHTLRIEVHNPETGVQNG